MSLFHQNGDVTGGANFQASANVHALAQRVSPAMASLSSSQPGMDTSVKASTTSKKHLQKAIHDNVLQLLYRPRVDLASGWIEGATALLHWIEPDGEPVTQATLLATAHECAMTIALGQWMLRDACRQNRAWQDAGLAPVRVSVPIPAELFRLTDIATRIGTILEETGLAAQHLEIEVAESALLEDLSRAERTLSALSTLGVTLTVTDVCFRASGDTHLATLPLDRIKLDGSLVAPAATARIGTTLARLLVAHAHSLGLAIVVDHVDSFEQFEFFRIHECFEMAGDFYYPPMDSAVMAQLLDRTSALPMR